MAELIITPGGPPLPVTVPNGGTGLATLTSGSLIVGAGTSTPTFLAPGSNGNVAVVAGGVWTSAAPATSASGLVCLAVATASNSANVAFTSLIDGTYDEYEIHWINAIPASSSQLWAYFSTDGGSTFANCSWTSDNATASTASAAANQNGGANTTAIRVSGGLVVNNTTAMGGSSGVLKLFSPNNATYNKHVTFLSTSANDASSDMTSASGGGTVLTTTAVNAMKFQQSSGNISSGSFKLYGVRKTV